MNGYGDKLMLSEIATVDSVAAVLLSSTGEHDEWESEIFDALCRTSSSTHLHFIMPPSTEVMQQVATSLTGLGGAVTGEFPRYLDFEAVFNCVATALASTGRSWSWSENPTPLTRSTRACGLPRYLVGAGRRPLYGLYLRSVGYSAI